jgi:predicted NBD/HSP70 family sugar kinase
MKGSIRVVECGGQGPRRVDVRGNEIVNSSEAVSLWGNYADFLTEFARWNLPPETRAIIYSVAGMVENHSRVISCPNVHMLDGVRLGNSAESPPSFVCNDMEASTTGVASMFPGLAYYMAITWSTGIGAWVWKNGILTDSETGHLRIDNSPFAPVCGCGLRGCAEAILAGPAIERFVVGQMRARKKEIPTDIHPCHWLRLCYNEGEEWAVRHYKEVLIPAMAQFLASVQTILHLPAIVWKGTLGLRSFKEIDGLELAIRQEMKARIINPSWVDDLKFYFLSCPQDYDAFIGAAQIAHNLLSVGPIFAD